MRLSWATGTHTGRVRSNNQDSVHPAPNSGETTDGLLIAVADGMGGHVGGEIASNTALSAAIATNGTPAERISAANQAVLGEVIANPSLRGMGTTLTMALIDHDGRATLGHVGDSRAYLLRDGELRQLTLDHTVIAEYLATGKITEEEAKRHPQRSVITRAVGIIDDLHIDEFSEDCRPGDRLLLCSDGLTAMVPDSDIMRVVRDNRPATAVSLLVDAANEMGGVDNITVAVVAFES